MNTRTLVAYLCGLLLVGCSSLPWTIQQTHIAPDGSRYIGDWRYGKPNGQGIEIDADGNTYTGGWKDGEPNGQGTQTFPNGLGAITGEFKDGKLVP